MKVTAYTGGRNVPSARLRLRQFIPHLLEHGIEIREQILQVGVVRPKQIAVQPFWAAATVAERLWDVSVSHAGDVSLFQRNIMPAFIPFERFTRSPRVLDVDDAIWISRGGSRCPNLARRCDLVICGNAFLAEHFSQWNQNVRVLPTAVNTDILKPREGEYTREKVLVWTGTAGNYKYLYDVENALARVLRNHAAARLRVVAEIPPKFSSIPAHQVDFVRWTPRTEVAAVRESSIGIMPLRNTDWERGKCSLKMLVYMACGLPVVASRVGMNKEVFARGAVGLGADTADQWVEAIDYLFSEYDAAARMGNTGRAIAVSEFDVRPLGSRLARLLYGVNDHSTLSQHQLDSIPSSVAHRGANAHSWN